MRNARFGTALVIGLLLAVLATPSVAFAQTAQGGNAMAMLGDSFLAINNAIDALAKNTWARALGTKVAWALFALMLIWNIIKSMLLGKGMSQLLADMMQPTIMLGIVLAAISHDFGSAVSRSVDAIASGVASTTGMSAKSETDIMADFAATAFKVFELKGRDSDGFNLSWDMFEAAFIYVIGMLMKLFAFLIILVAGALAAGLLFISKVMVGIALGLGPILFCWGVWKPTEFLFNGWLRFLISAGLQKVVITLLAGFVSVGLTKMSSLSDNLTGQVTVDVVAYGVLLLFSVLSTMLLWKAPSIAEGLLSGGGGMDLSRWNATAMSAGATAGAAGTAANKAGGSVIGGLVAGVQAARGVDSSAGSSQPKTVTGYASRGVSAAMTSAASAAGNAMRSRFGGGGASAGPSGQDQGGQSAGGSSQGGSSARSRKTGRV